MGPKRKAGARSKATAKPLPLQPPTAPQQPALTAASFASSQLFVRWIGQLEGPVEEGSSAGGLFTQHKMALASRFNHELKWLASYAQELEAGMASGQVNTISLLKTPSAKMSSALLKEFDSQNITTTTKLKKRKLDHSASVTTEEQDEDRHPQDQHQLLQQQEEEEEPQSQQQPQGDSTLSAHSGKVVQQSSPQPAIFSSTIIPTGTSKNSRSAGERSVHSKSSSPVFKSTDEQISASMRNQLLPSTSAATLPTSSSMYIPSSINQSDLGPNSSVVPSSSTSSSAATVSINPTSTSAATSALSTSSSSTTTSAAATNILPSSSKTIGSKMSALKTLSLKSLRPSTSSSNGNTLGSSSGSSNASSTRNSSRGGLLPPKLSMVVSTLPELGMFDAASAPSVSSKKKQQPLQNAMIVDKIVEENEEEIEEGELVEEVYDNNVGHQSMMLLDEDESAATGSASSSSTSKKLNNEGIFDAKTSTLIEIPLAAAATATITAVEEHQRHEERMNHLLSSKNENIKKMMSSLSAKIGLSSTLAASASAQSRSVGTPLSAAVTMGSMATEVDSKSAPRIEKIMMMEMNAKSQESSTAVAAALASSLPKAVKSSGETLDMLVTSTTASDESTSSQKPSASLITAKKVSLGTLLFGDEFAQQSSGKCVSSTSTLPNACSKEDHMDEDVAIVAANSGSASTEDDRDSFYSAHGDSVDAVVNKMEEDRPASIASSTNATTSAVTSSIATTDNTILPSSSSISATLGTQHTIPSRVPGKVGKDLVDLNEKSTSIPPPSKAAASYDKNPLSHTTKLLANLAKSQSQQSQIGKPSASSSGKIQGAGGAKPEIKSLIAAAALVKKEQAEKERKAQFKDAADRRQQNAATSSKLKSATAHIDDIPPSSSVSTKTLSVAVNVAKKNDKQSAAITTAAPVSSVKQTSQSNTQASQKPAALAKAFEFAKPAPVAPSINRTAAASAATSAKHTPTFAVPLPLPPREQPQMPIKNPILGSFYDDQEVDMIDHSSDAYAQKPIGGGQSIVDENGEIPDIDTDEDLDSSGDEALPNNSKPPLPDWAQSQNLSRSLQNQRLIDPDPIFGIIAVCDLEDIFKGSVNSKRLKKRSSSANWTGVDQLTQAEEQSYKKRMGYNDYPPSTSPRFPKL